MLEVQVAERRGRIALVSGLARHERVRGDVEREQLAVHLLDHRRDDRGHDGARGVQRVGVGGREADEGGEVGDARGERGERGGVDVLHCVCDICLIYV